MPLSRDRQLKKLIAISSPCLEGFRLEIGFAAVPLGCLVGGILTGYPAYYYGTLFGGIVTLATWRSIPHLRNAIQGAKVGRRTTGKIEIKIEKWSDTDTYSVVVSNSQQGNWMFEFIPSGWSPSEGSMIAELIFIAEVEWPVLILTSDGILYPRYRPKLVTANGLQST